MKVNQTQRAAVTWNILTRVAREGKTITHGYLAAELEIHHRPVRHILKVIQSYCLEEHLPPLTILVPDQHGHLGKGFIAWDMDNLEEGVQSVRNYNWENLSNPFSYALGGETEEQIIREMLADPVHTVELYHRIKSRGIAQSIFRKALLAAYNGKCSFCGLGIKVVLEGAHIVSWTKSTAGMRVNVQNGLLLCATHHKMFDNRLLTVSDEYVIQLSVKEAKRILKPDQLVISKLVGKKILLPVLPIHWPSSEYLDKHRMKVVS